MFKKIKASQSYQKIKKHKVIPSGWMYDDSRVHNNNL